MYSEILLVVSLDLNLLMFCDGEPESQYCCFACSASSSFLLLEMRLLVELFGFTGLLCSWTGLCDL